MALPIVRLPACENWEAKTREQLLLFPSCCPWCGGNLGFTDRRTSAQRSGQRGKRTVLPRQGRKPLKTRLHGPGLSRFVRKKASFSFGPAAARFLFGKTKRKWGAETFPWQGPCQKYLVPGGTKSPRPTLENEQKNADPGSKQHHDWIPHRRERRRKEGGPQWQR